jgi:16S rRNA (adenine1518-N6/adenine1519-N6)-dimethyltransferase
VAQKKKYPHPSPLPGQGEGEGGERRANTRAHAIADDAPARALRAAGVTPTKKRGQNFLAQSAVADRIVALADLRAGDEVMEIGPGLGVLSERILAAPISMLHLIELDRELAARLRQRLAGAVNLIEADLLKVDLRQMLAHPPIKVIGNLPFNVAAAILRKLGEVRDLISRMVLMFQREVGERLRAGAGDSAYGALSALTALDWEIQRHFRVEAGSFHPRPKVDAEVLCFVPARASVCPPELRSIVTDVIRAGFAIRRKTLRNALGAGLRMRPECVEAALGMANIAASERAERLDLADFVRLAAALETVIADHAQYARNA